MDSISVPVPPVPAGGRISGAEAMMRAAHAAGLRVCFANPGTTEMHIVAALDALHPALRPVLGLHETVCSGAADGYGRLSGGARPALVLLHLGPGLMNALSQLHNARRAGAPVVVLVGDFAGAHQGLDAPLETDIAALAATVSKAVIVSTCAAGLAADMARAVAMCATPGPVLARRRRPDAAPSPADAAAAAAAAAAEEPESGEEPGAGALGGSRIVTLIAAHDHQWDRISYEPIGQAAMQTQVGSGPPGGGRGGASAEPPAGADSSDAAGQGQLQAAAAAAFVRDLAAALKAAPRGSVVFLLGGGALMTAPEDPAGTATGGALGAAGRAAACVGAAIFAVTWFARMDRGAGRPKVARLPYFPNEAQRELAKYSTVVLLDCPRPVGMFAYETGPRGILLTQPEDSIWELDASALPGGDLGQLLEMLAAELGAPAAPARAAPAAAWEAAVARPPAPARGRLSAAAMCATIARLQPAGAIIMDESLTSGNAYYADSASVPPFTHLALTGGAIGSGPVVSVGAAIACPGRRVINIQADGSALYSLPALWTQAREQLDVVTVICSNRRYAILQLEAALQRVGPAGAATRALTDLDGPPADWVLLARGLGLKHAARAETVEALEELLAAALARPGPSLIEAVLTPGPPGAGPLGAASTPTLTPSAAGA